ncbi:MAG: hypothetical protein AAF799_18385 [Myxococcota bacterium]
MNDPLALSNLATMMQRAGLLPEGESVRIRDFAYANRVPPVEVIIHRGLSSEEDLVRFLQSKLMIPEVEADLLDQLERETLRHLPIELAWYHEVLPVSVDDVGNLTLAMADPTDLRAVDAVANHTGAYLVRAVAPLTALRRALERYYGPRPANLPIGAGQDEPAPAPAPAVSDPPASETPAQTRAAPPPTRQRSATPVPVATVRTDSGRLVDENFPPLSPAAFARVLPRLVAAADRDEITRVLLDFLAEGFDRVIMFVHLQKQLRGRDARGDDLLLEAVTQVRIPTTGPSAFRDVIERGAPYFGPWRNTSKINKAFDQAMGSITGNVLVLPVRLRERVPLLVYASGTRHPVDPRSLNELVDGISQALERLIFRRKSQDLPRVEG